MFLTFQDSNKQLTTLFRTIFDKCLKTENELEFSSITINETSSTTATTTRSSSSRARCKDLIECLTSEINHTHNQVRLVATVAVAISFFFSIN